MNSEIERQWGILGLPVKRLSKGEISVECECESNQFWQFENLGNPKDELYQCAVCMKVFRVVLVVEKQPIREVR